MPNSLFLSPTAPFPDLTTPPRILQPIETGDYIGRTFTAYLWHLRKLDQVVVLRLSLAAYAELLLLDDASGSHHVADLSWLPTYLQVLNNSLNSLHECFTGAYGLLTDFMEMGADFEQFAASKRAEDAQWYGYLDPLDVSPDGQSIVLRSEPEALAPYQLATLLAPHFSGAGRLGERIGSSQPSTLNFFHNTILNGVLFTAPDPVSQPGTPANLMAYPWTEDEPMPTEEEEQVEGEEQDRFYLVDKTLTGAEVVERLNAILELGQQAAGLFHTLHSQNSRDIGSFRRLFQLLAKAHRE